MKHFKSIWMTQSTLPTSLCPCLMMLRLFRPHQCKRWSPMATLSPRHLRGISEGETEVEWLSQTTPVTSTINCFIILIPLFWICITLLTPSYPQWPVQHEAAHVEKETENKNTQYLFYILFCILFVNVCNKIKRGKKPTPDLWFCKKWTVCVCVLLRLSDLFPI